MGVITSSQVSTLQDDEQTLHYVHMYVHTYVVKDTIVVEKRYLPMQNWLIVLSRVRAIIIFSFTSSEN